MRKRQREDEDNTDRWLVSYADFITLLFAFFVVMYAISSVNEGKYRVLTETLTDAFQDQGQKDRGSPIGVEPGGQLMPLPEPLPPLQEALPEAPLETPLETPQQAQSQPKPDPDPEPQTPAEPAPAEESLLALGARLEQALGDLLAQNLASIDYHKDWIELNLDSQLLFETGAARLNREALRALRELSRVLKGGPNLINIEGHTDNIPIRTREFPSNWELSAARAASVAHYLARLGLEPQRLSAIGFGEYQPRGDNASAEGRAQNRRVSLLILAADAVPVGPMRGPVRNPAATGGGAAP
ncbi:MAG: flagellar motor protein MotD [Gammaproteobacteria bacterium]|nr:flagellar motor protein MotD [Gammaproteobacteria bacterium]